MISKQVYGCLFFMDVRVNDVLRKSKSHDGSWLIFDSPPAGSHPWECFCLCPAECPLQATSCWRLECHLELITEQQSEYFIPHLLSYWQIIPSERSSTTFIVLFIRFFFFFYSFLNLRSLSDGCWRSLRVWCHSHVSLLNTASGGLA